jgi:5-hydroxyisourate hydrolase
MDLEPGVYRMVFEIGERFPEGFYPEVSITFVIRDASTHYHVPLLISPFGFTTYRGS